jgi:hypothetical protein
MKLADKIKVLEYLKSHPEQYFTAKKLSDELGIDSKFTQRDIRLAIEELVEKDAVAIIATPTGFAYTSDKDKLARYLENLNKRQFGIARRIIAIQNRLKEDYREPVREVQNAELQ